MSPVKSEYYKSAGKSPSPNETTLRARLMNMHDMLVELVGNVQMVRKEVKDYKDQIGEWKKVENSISLKARNEQQATAKRLGRC